MPKYNHAFDVAFEVVSEHENWRDIPIKDVLAGLEKRLETLKANEAEAHDACSGYDVFEVEESESNNQDKET